MEERLSLVIFWLFFVAGTDQRLPQEIFKTVPKGEFFSPFVIISLSEQVNNYVLLKATQHSFLAEMYVE